MAVVRVYDRANSNWISVPDTDATDMVSSGKFGFESGVSLPVTYSDGRIGQVPSDNFESGVLAGDFRFQTQDDLKQYEAQQQEAINQKNFGTPETTAGHLGTLTLLAMGPTGLLFMPAQTQAAVAQGGLRGATFGLSDLAMQGMGGISGHGDDVKESLKQTKDRNPTASMGGEIAGALGNSVLTEAGSAVREFGESVAGTALEKLGESMPAQIAQGFGKAVAGGMGEGAFYGLGQGISEASLGDPSEVAQNLAAGPGMGALFGGSFGAAFAATKAASPYFKSAINTATNAGEELVSSALNRTAKASLNVAPSIGEQAEYAKALASSGLEDTLEAFQLYQNGGSQALKDAGSKVDELHGQLAKDYEKRAKDLNTFLDSQPKAIRLQIEEDLKANTNNLGSLLESSIGRMEANKQMLMSNMKMDHEAGTLFGDIHEETTQAIKQLELSKDLKAKAIARRLQSRLDAEMSAKGITQIPLENLGVPQGGERAFIGRNTQGSDGILARELMEEARLGSETRLPESASDALSSYTDSIKSLTYENPKWGDQLKKLDDMGSAFQSAREFATTAVDENNTKVKNGVIKSILTDPRRARDFDQVFSNLSEFMPEFQAYRDAGSNALQKMNALREASSKFDAIRNSSFDRGITLDDMQTLFDSFGFPKEMGEKVLQLRGIQAQLAQSTDAGPISKYIRLMKFLGNDVSPELEKLKPFEGAFSIIDKLKDTGKGKDQFGNYVLRSAVSRLARKVGRFLGGPILGEAAGMGAQVVLNGGINQFNVLRTLNKLNGLNRTSMKAVSTATERAINYLTGADVSRFGSVVAGVTGERHLKEKPQSIQEARSNFQERSDYINKLTTDPNFLANEAQSRIAGLEHTPAIASSLATQFANTAYYLSSVMPKNPSMGQDILGSKNKWTPSDSSLLSFEKSVQAAENPARAIQEMSSGRVSPETIQALQALQPAAFARLQRGLSDAIMSNKTSLTYQQKLNIGKVLGIQPDSTLSPSFISAMQANHQTQGAGAPPQGPRGPYKGGVYPSRININTDAKMTDTQRFTH